MAVAGFTWYQGEANTASEASAKSYACKFPGLIEGWRQQFKAANLYFGFASHARPHTRTSAHPHTRTPAHPHTRRSETFLSSLFLRNPLTPPPSPPNPCLPPNNILIMCGICNDCMVTNIGPVVHVVCYPCRFACPDAGGANDSSSNAKRWVGYKR